MSVKARGVAFALLMTALSPVQAQTIIGATSAVVNKSGPGDPSGSIISTYNQSGLSTPYVSGVTNFDAYLAGGPFHTTLYSRFEWFGNSGTTDALVTYDLGQLFNIDRLALWNEEFAGIGLLNVLGSTDGVTFSTIGAGFKPTNNVYLGNPYFADVFALTPTSLRYVRLDASGCPQPDGGPYTACSIGEVAFRTAAPAVPEPATWAMMIAGMGLVGATMRRRAAWVRTLIA